MTRKYFSLVIFLTLLAGVAYGQQNASGTTSNDIFKKIETESDGNIRFSQPDSLHNLILKHIAANRQQKGIPGYRIRIFSDLGMDARQKSAQTKTAFYEKYPDIPIYREYDSPYFKVYVGDFRTKIEAIKCLKRIKPNFPSAFVVPDQINYPELD